MMTFIVRLCLLSNGTTFRLINGREYRKTVDAINDKIQCQPFLGGQFQTDQALTELISAETMVSVTVNLVPSSMTTYPVLLRHLSPGTEFILHAQKYKTMGAINGKIRCQPLIGGQFQTAQAHEELISAETMVGVDAWQRSFH